MPSREESISWFESQGARVSNSTTQKTNVVIIGDEPGATKIDKARQYNIPTLRWEMFVYLGLAEPRGEYRLDIPSDIVSEFLINAAVTCELLYAKAIRHNSARYYRCFLAAAAGVEGILHAAWGNPRRADRDSAEDANRGAGVLFTVESGL